MAQIQRNQNQRLRWFQVRPQFLLVGVMGVCIGAVVGNHCLLPAPPTVMQVCRYKSSPEPIFTKLKPAEAKKIKSELAKECNLMVCGSQALKATARNCEFATDKKIDDVQAAHTKDQETRSSLIQACFYVLYGLTPVGIFGLIRSIVRSKRKRKEQEAASANPQN